jgi:tetratricopeptide (TPR) repeat protein
LTLGLIKYEHRPLQQVVDDLYAARGELFDDLFERAWALLDEAGRRVLLAMVFFLGSASSAALGATADVQGFAFDRAVERLTDLALLDGVQVTLTNLPRYALHPLVRAFAGAKLAQDRDLEYRARLRWSNYFVNLVSDSIVRNFPRDRYWNTLPNAGMNQIDSERSNILRVVEWADQAAQDSLLLDLTILLMHYMERRGLYTQREYYTRKSIEAARRLDKRKDEILLHMDALGWLLTEEDRLDEAEAEILTGIEQLKLLPPTDADLHDLLALGYAFLARVHLYKGNAVKARELIDRALNIRCGATIRYRVLWIAGEVTLEMADYDAALAFYDEMNRAGQAYGGEQGNTRIEVGFVYLAQGDLAGAVSVFNEIFQSQGVVHAIQATYGLACVAYAEGATESARLLCQEAQEKLARLEIRHRVATQVKQLLEKIGQP